MTAAIQRIASLANGLSKAELHVLIELAARMNSNNGLHVSASSRDLAETTGLARSSVQGAIDSLNEKFLVKSSYGSVTQPAVHRLDCLRSVENVGEDVAEATEVAHYSGPGGLKFGPGVAQNLSQGGLNSEPGVAQDSGQGGLKYEPPRNGKSTTCAVGHRERAIVRADPIDLELDKTIDRLQKAQKTDFDDRLFEHARNQIASHNAKYSRPENLIPHLPDHKITAQFLAVAEWPKLERMLCDLASERKEAGHSHGWYVAVALQRIHGISPDQVRRIRIRLKAARSIESSRAVMSTPEGIRAVDLSARAQGDTSFETKAPRKISAVEQLRQQIRDLASARSL